MILKIMQVNIRLGCILCSNCNLGKRSITLYWDGVFAKVMVDVVSNTNGDNRITIGSGTEKGKGVGGKGGERVHRVNYFPKCRANQVMLSGVLHL